MVGPVPREELGAGREGRGATAVTWIGAPTPGRVATRGCWLRAPGQVPGIASSLVNTICKVTPLRDGAK